MINNVKEIWEHAVSKISQFLLLLSGILVFLMAWVVTYGVVMRYVFNAPNPYVYEISIMFLLFCGIFAVPAVERMNRHIHNDILVARFSPEVREVFTRLIIPILALPCCMILTWKGWANAAFALKIGQETQSSLLPTAPIKFTIPICYGLLTIVVIGKIFDGLCLLKNKIGKKTKEELNNPSISETDT
ncbi:MAG: TRAP transporter small permease [Deltaproteobacteria bacterium]|nr:TRAP transporter small permease [Deltaproteobacteria bacterium]